MPRHSARRIEIQISARVRRPKGARITPALLREAIAYRLEHGQDPPGIRLRIVGWTKGGRHKDAAGRSQDQIWEDWTPLLRARLLDPAKIRTSPRAASAKSGIL